MKAAERSSVFEVFADLPDAMNWLRRAINGEPGSVMTAAYGRYYDVQANPIFSPTGEVSLVAAIATDVTEREQARSEQQNLALLAHSALRINDFNQLWQNAVSTLASRLKATAMVHTTKPGREPELAAAAGPPPPSSVLAAVWAPYPASSRRWQGQTNNEIEHIHYVDGWSTVSARLGRPDEATAMLTVHRADRPCAPDNQSDYKRTSPRPASGPFRRREVEFVLAVADLLSSAVIRLEMEREARHCALHDSLTNLPNRAAFTEELRGSLEQSRPDSCRTAIVFLDLDGFKSINDTFGHSAGDTVLCRVADRLRASVRPSDIVARLAGDEFAVLCQSIEDVTEVEQIAHRIITAVALPIAVSETDVTVTASAGIAVSGGDLTDPDRLLNASDHAMYAAKRAGPSRCFVHRPGEAPNAPQSVCSPE